jgi:hypothetical protein
MALFRDNAAYIKRLCSPDAYRTAKLLLNDYYVPGNSHVMAMATIPAIMVRSPYPTRPRLQM